MNKWNGKKKVFVLFIAILLIIGLIVTVFIVQKNQDTRTSAQKATVLSLSPQNQSVEVGQELSMDIIIDPGVNQVNFVKAVIKFDSTKFDSSATTFTSDSNSTLTLINEPVISDGQIIIILNTGSSPTDVITTPGKIGALKLKVWDQESSNFSSGIAGETQITFDESQTQVLSIGSTDTFNENVLSGTTPATIIIEAICKLDIAICSWDSVEGANSYHYVVKDVDLNEVILEGDTNQTSIEFNFAPDVYYSCNVTAQNECGTGDSGEGTGTCETPLVSVTPTPLVTVTPTPISSLTSTPILTPTPAITSYNSPTPTVKSVIESPTPTYITEVTQTPSIAPTGNPVVMLGGIIGGVLIILGGIVLLFL